jgi:uncharacterized membrane protein
MHVEFVKFASAHLAVALAVLGIPSGPFWLYFSATILLIIGLIKIFKTELPKMHGLDKILPFGRLFFTIPLAVFGTEHFTNTADIAQIVPSWMPAHVFWVYFVGIGLIAAALSITVEIQAPLAATLVGVMFFLFVCMMDIPGLMAGLNNRFSWALALRETAFSGGGLAYAGSHWISSGRRTMPWLVTVAKFFIAIPAVFYGVETFLHPANAPGVPLEKIMPVWIPARLAWAYLAGVVLFVAGLAVIINKKAQLAATYMGILILLLMLFVYLPFLVANPTDLEALNYFFDTLLFCGTIFVLADALRERTSAG